MIAYYKSPDMDRGKSLDEDFSSSREEEISTLRGVC